MKKVLIFKEDLLPVSETFIDSQAGALRSFEPVYIGLGRSHPSIPLRSSPILLTRNNNSLSHLRRSIYRRVYVAPLFHRRARKTQPDLIHAHFASGGRSAICLARRLKIPLLVTLHGSDVTVKVRFQERYRALWETSSRFVCVSEFIRRKALEAGFPEAKLLVHYIGVDSRRFTPQATPRKDEIVLFVGRLIEKKGCEHLLHAMRIVQERVNNVRLVVVGDGPLRGKLSELALRLGVRCEFLGVLSSPMIRSQLDAAKVFCVPSVTASNGDSEGLGIVFLEAQAMGLPVVSFDHGGIPEAVCHGSTGLLAPEGNRDVLASHITRYLLEPEFAALCGRSGTERVRTRFDLHRQTEKLEHLYEEVLAGWFARPKN